MSDDPTRELRSLAAERRDDELNAWVRQRPPAQTAEEIRTWPFAEVVRLLTALRPELRSEVFPFLPTPLQLELVRNLPPPRLAELLGQMPHDDRVDLLKRLSPRLVESLLPALPEADRADIRTLMAYPEEVVGAVMTTDFASVPADVTVAEALDLLRRQAVEAETIHFVLVPAADGTLLGAVTLRDLVLADPTETVRGRLRTHLPTIRPDEDRAAAVRLLHRSGLPALPVVDAAGRAVGIVTLDDALVFSGEEATADAHRMGAVVPLEAAYLDAPFVRVWLSRALWLSALFLAELFTFSAMAGFEDSIKAITALSLFVPLCLSTGGNSGAQAATLITRSLAVGEVTLGGWWRVLRHELLMGIVLGLTLGAIGFVRASLTPASVLGGVDRWLMAWVIAQSVACICLWGSLVGAMLPLIFRRLGADPAYASSPFVSTFVDVTGITIYFTIAQAYLLRG